MNTLEFFVHLCYDVFLEVVRFGNRRRLCKLERIGRRIHRMISIDFSEAPFVRIGLWPIAQSDRFYLNFRRKKLIEFWLPSSIYSHELRNLIRGKNRDYYYPIEDFGIFNFEEIPPFIRFHEVDLRYVFTGKGSIEEKCLRLKNHLQSIKQHLKD